MYKIAAPVFLICETPLHAGSGDSLGVVDLPIQRERHTSFPKIEGSSLKGAIRQAFEDLSTPENNEYKLIEKGSGQKLTKWCSNLNDKWIKKNRDDKDEEQKDKKENTLTKYQEAINLTFGPENAGNDGHAGALGFTDARLLLFPVKSMKGVFAWITCPKVLEQFKRDMQVAKEKVEHEEKETKTPTSILDNIPSSSQNSSALLSSDDLIVNQTAQDDKRSIVLEEYSFKGEKNDDVTKLAKWLSENITKENFWKEKLKSNLVVLPDEDFTDFVNLSTEVITRTKINNATGTVEQGALFTEEYLPAESVMYSLALASPIFKEKNEEKGIFNLESKQNEECKDEKEEQLVMEFFKKGLPEVIQVGGNATLGKGLVRTKFL